MRRVLPAVVIGYLLGAIPSADIASRLSPGRSVDLRSEGSGNPGGMNALRLLSGRAGAAVIVADVGKGIVSCACGRRLAGDLGAHVAGVAAVAGHCFPVWTRFRGGKGVATSFGQCVYTFPAFAPFDAVLAVAVARSSRLRHPALASVLVSSSAWLAVSVVWWKRDLPNLWGPRPTFALPLANAATLLVIGSKALALLFRRESG
ncbi:MAG: plsY [Thermoleophilia bacterium]|nr:plsY [Thermoleophilia bacterium]